MQDKLVIKFKRLSEDSVLPSYSKSGDAGMDLVATSYDNISNFPDYIEYGTGLAVEIPEGYVGLLFPRSSISNRKLILANSVGVIDSGYRGEIKCRFKHLNGAYDYEVGDKIAQLVIIPYPTIEPVWSEELSETERNEGGFGSTDVVKTTNDSVIDDFIIDD